MNTNFLAVMMLLGAMTVGAQTNAVAVKPTAKPTLGKAAPADPLAQIKAAIRTREQRVSDLKSKVIELAKTRTEVGDRMALQRAAGNYRHDAVATKKAEHLLQQMDALKKQQATLELEILDLRKRYKIPAK